MAITGSTQAEPLSQDGIFFGLPAPVQPGNPNAVPISGSLWIVTPVLAVVQGAPGAFMPAALTPADLPDLLQHGTVGQTTPWAPGNHVTLVDGTDVYWDGNQWVAGVAPDRLGAVLAGTPGSFQSVLGVTLPANDPLIPADLAQLNLAGALGNTAAWGPGEYVTTNDGNDVYWDGNRWTAGRVALPLATTVTAGAPGTFGPVGTRPPVDAGELATINGGAAWTTPGFYVTVGGNETYWDGAAWVPGRVPALLATTVTPGSPGIFGPVNSRDPLDKTELDTINGGAIWTVQGDYITVAGQDYYWDGAAWQTGRVPAPATVTGFTLGKPGSFTGGTTIPGSLNELQTQQTFWNQQLGITHQWPAGTYVTLGDGSQAYWNGTAWAAGPSNAANGVNKTMTPFRFLPANVGSAPVNLATAQYWVTNGETSGQTTPWNAGESVLLRDNTTRIHWDGVNWQAGVASGTVANVGPDRTLTAATWTGQNVTPDSADNAPDTVQIQATGDNRLFIAWNEIADPTLYVAGQTEVQVLDAAGTTAIWSTRNTAGNRINGVSVTGYTGGVNPVRVIMHYNDGTIFTVEVNP